MHAGKLPTNWVIALVLLTEFLYNPDSQHTQEGKDPGLEKAAEESPSLTGRVCQGSFLAL